jgi:hypothetical protein
MDDLPDDETLMQVEAICQLADSINNTTNKDVRRRLLQAMDLVIAKLGPVAARGHLIDVAGRNCN